MKKVLFFTVYFITVSALFSQTSFIRGEELFMQNKPADALVFLENAVIEDPAHIKAYLYLGIVYEQLNKLDDAIAVYRRIINRDPSLDPYIATNLGNIYFRKGDLKNAEAYYTQAIAADTSFSSAFLARANTRIKNNALHDAISDYERYLALNPGSAQRTQIERLILFIRTEAAAEERRKLIAEQNAREEAERRQRILDDLAASLQSAAGGSQGLSSGAENVEGYDGEFELD